MCQRLFPSFSPSNQPKPHSPHPPHPTADVHAGNLLVLPDGRVGFIDFGIVGRIS